MLRKAFYGFDAHPPGGLLLSLRDSSPCVVKSDYNLRGLRPLNPRRFLDRLNICYADSPTAECAKHAGTRLKQTISRLRAIAITRILTDVVTVLHFPAYQLGPAEIGLAGVRKRRPAINQLAVFNVYGQVSIISAHNLSLLTSKLCISIHKHLINQDQ